MLAGKRREKDCRQSAWLAMRLWNRCKFWTCHIHLFGWYRRGLTGPLIPTLCSEWHPFFSIEFNDLQLANEVIVFWGVFVG